MLSIRCDIFCTLIDVLLIYMVLMWWDKLSLLSLIKVNYHIAIATLPIVSYTASLPLVDHNTSILKNMISKHVCVSIYATQLPFLKYMRHKDFYSPTMELYCFCLPDFLSTLVTAAQFSFGESPLPYLQSLWHEWGWSYLSPNHPISKNKNMSKLDHWVYCMTHSQWMVQSKGHNPVRWIRIIL